MKRRCPIKSGMTSKEAFQHPHKKGKSPASARDFLCFKFLLYFVLSRTTLVRNVAPFWEPSMRRMRIISLSLAVSANLLNTLSLFLAMTASLIDKFNIFHLN